MGSDDRGVTGNPREGGARRVVPDHLCPPARPRGRVVPLMLAGKSLDVGPGTSPRSPRRRRWLLFIALVVLGAVVAALLQGRGSDDGAGNEAGDNEAGTEEDTVTEVVLREDFTDDVGWTRYPQVIEGEESATPLGGISLGIGAFSTQPELAVEAIRCLRSLESQKAYMQTAGDPGASAALYEDPDIKEQFPMAAEIREGLEDAGPRPITPFYGDVTAAIQEGYHPPDSLDEDSTPEETATLIEAVLSNEQLL